MRREDAPGAGWYPDPQDRQRLRWWDGLDWTEARRAPPSAAELRSYERFVADAAAQRPDRAHAAAVPAPPQSFNTVESQKMVEEVRRATRSEVQHAADLFSQRARQMQQDITPLISDYTNRLVRWIRFAAIIAVVLLVAYFIFQVVAQASLFEWIGDRIDNLTDDSTGAPLGWWQPPPR